MSASLLAPAPPGMVGKEPMEAIQSIAKKGRLTLSDGRWVVHCVSLIGEELAECIARLPSPEGAAPGDERCTRAKATLLELAAACEELVRAADDLGSRSEVTIFELPGCEKLGEDRPAQ